MSAKRKILNFIGFQIGWFSCAIGAGKGLQWFGPVVVLILITLHLIFSENHKVEIFLIVVSGIGGTIIDSILSSAGAFNFPGNPIAPVCPPFMIALWLNFATVLNYSLAWLKKRLIPAAVLGFFGGPLAYYTGTQFGAITLTENATLSLGVIGVEWAIVTPALFALAEHVNRKWNNTDAPK